MRRTVCRLAKCAPLPSIIKAKLVPIRLAQMPEEIALRWIIMAETAAEPELLTPLIEIINDVKIPTILRERCILALRPLLPRMHTKITATLLRDIVEKKDLPSGMKVLMYTVLLERPTPIVIHTIVQKLMTIETCEFRRQFVYETILSLIHNKEIPISRETRLACQYALTVLRRQETIYNRLTRPSIIPSNTMTTLRPLSNANIRLTMKNQVHLTRESSMPRHLIHNTEIEILGRRINLLDVDLHVTGLQQLINKMIKITPEKTVIQPLEIVSTIRVLDEPMMTLYKRVQRNEAKPTLLEKVLPKDFVLWKNLAEELNKDLTMETEKTMMPVELLMILPTSTGLPLTMELNTILHYKMKTKMNVETPSLFDLPKLAFQEKDLKLKASLNLRSTLTAITRVFIETRFVTIGLKNCRDVSTMLDTRTNMTFNPETMKIASDLQMPKIPEIMTTEVHTELFIEQRVGPKKINKVIPTMMEHIMPRVHILGEPLKTTEELHSRITLKVGEKYISVDEKTREVILAEQPMKWIVIPRPTNQRFVALRHPTLGYVTIDMTTKALKISTEKPTYFFIEHHTLGIQLKTLVPRDLPTIPTLEELKKLQKPVMDLVMQFQSQQLTDEIIQRFVLWRNVDPQKALQIVYVRFLNNKASIAPIKDTELSIQKQIIESSTERIRCEARNRGTCLTKQSPILPICMYGVLPRQTVLNIDALFMPMLFEVALPDHLKKIHLEHTLKTENKLDISLTRIQLIGMEKEIRLRLVLDEERMPREITIEQFAKGLTQGNLACLRLAPTPNSFEFYMSFDPKCMIKHVEITPVAITNKLWPRLHMEFNWFVRLEKLPLPIRRTIISILQTIFNPATIHGIERLPLEITTKEIFPESEITKGTLSLRKLGPALLSVKLNSPFLPAFEMEIPISKRIESLPGIYGPKTLTRFTKLATRRVCTLLRDTMTTFDDVDYKFTMPTPKCEQILVETTKELRGVKVTTQKAGRFQILRLRINDVIVEVVPTKETVIPTVKINGKETEVKPDQKIILPNKLVMIVRWVEDLREFRIVINHLMMELSMRSGNIISIAMEPTVYMGQVHGMCGHMDMEKSKEMMTPEKVAVTDPELFILTWLNPATKCTQKECPMIRSVIPTEAGCRPIMALPTCMEKCQPIKEVLIKEVPVKCARGEQKMLPMKVPIECQCTC
ncbi:vitellogenin-like [Clytia hemisphaerica]